jgi:hypothetical protein
MTKHKYALQHFKGMNTRHKCPSCQNHKKTFALYIDVDTEEPLHEDVGRCNRESNCAYHYTPKQYFQDNNISMDQTQPKSNILRPETPKLKAVSFIPADILKASLKAYSTNYFVQFLNNRFGIKITDGLIERYFIGTSKHWNGATVFWQIDENGKIRTGKIMLYSASNGKRAKEPDNLIYWAHKALKQPDFELQQCLYGEHLLSDKTKPVAIVESEKTAIIASLYLPEFIWLACGGKDGLQFEKMNVLKGRKVVLFPDLNGFEKWRKKAKEFSDIANFTVSEMLEKNASEAEKKEGFDLADYLLRFPLGEFINNESKPVEPEKSLQQLPEPKKIVSQIRQPEKYIQKSWELQQLELENYWNDIKPMIEPFMIAYKEHKISKQLETPN